MRALYLGGSKSGKSMTSQRLCLELDDGRGELLYWATMIPSDDEDRRRIKRHLEDRDGWGFKTIEAGRDISDDFSAAGEESTVLFDSVTALLSNEMFRSEVGEDGASEYLFLPDTWEKVKRDILDLSLRVKNIVCVCDYIFGDGSRYDAWTEGYVRGLALVCRGLAEEFDTVVEMTSGIGHRWK